MPRSPGMGESGHCRLGAAAIHGRDGVANGLERARRTGKQQGGMPVFAPQRTQRLIGQIRQRHQAVLMSLATSDRHLLALPIDITNLQCQGLPEPQSHRVGRQQKHPIPQMTGRSN